MVDQDTFPSAGYVDVGPLVPGEYQVTEVDPGPSWSITILDSYMIPTDGIVYVYPGTSPQEPVLVQVVNTEITTTTSSSTTSTTVQSTTTSSSSTTTTVGVTTTAGDTTTTTAGGTTSTTIGVTTTAGETTTTSEPPTTVGRATTTTVLGVLGVQAGGGGLAGGSPIGWVLIALGCLTVAGGAARYLKPGVKTSS